MQNEKRLLSQKPLPHKHCSMVGLKLATHFFTYSGIFGVTCYQTFFAGIAAYKALPLEKFSDLQRVVFKGYFTIQVALQTILIASLPFKPSKAQILCLLGALLGSAANLFTINPKTDHVITRRSELCREEGKTYKDPTVSDDIKKLNKEFSKLHGQAMMANMVVLFSTVVYGFFFIAKVF